MFLLVSELDCCTFSRQRKGQFTCLDVLALIQKPLSIQNIC